MRSLHHFMKEITITNTFVSSIVLGLFNCQVQSNNKPGTLIEALSTQELIETSVTAVGTIFSKTAGYHSEAICAHPCIYLILYVFNIVEARETSCFLCL